MSDQIKEIKFSTNGKTYKIVDSQARENIEEINSQISDINFQDYYTKQQINTKIASAVATAQLQGAEVNLDGYYDKDEVDTMVSNCYNKTEAQNLYYDKTTTDTLLSNATGGLKFAVLTETEYNALSTKETDTVYFIIE